MDIVEKAVAVLERQASYTLDSLTRVAFDYDLKEQKAGNAPLFCMLTKKQWREVVSRVA